MEVIPILRPKLPKAADVFSLLERIDQNRIYSNYGPILEEYKAEIARYLKIDPELIVILSNATLGIQGAVSILTPKIWQVPNFTFAASGLAVLQANKQVLLRDVNLETWKLDIPETKSVTSDGFLPVAPFGSPLDISEWSLIPNVIFDAAASLGAPILNIEELNSSSAIVFSVHATKVLGAGEGGIVICGSKEMADELKMWSNFGFTAARESAIVGTNAKMPEISAAYGLTSLLQRETEFEEWGDARNKISPIIKEFGIDNVTSTYCGSNPYWIISLDSKEQCDEMSEALKLASIESRKWWPHQLKSMPIFRDLEGVGKYPNSQDIIDTTLGLPFYRGISEIHIERIYKVLGTKLR